MVDELVAAHRERYRASGAELVMGSGRFVGPKVVEVALEDGGTRTRAGERVFLNVGTHAGVDVVLDAEIVGDDSRSGSDVRLRVRTPSGATSPAATCWWLPGAPPIPAASGSSAPASRATAAASSGERPARNHGSQGLGDRRVRRQPAVHARVGRRLPGHPRQPRGNAAARATG